jgi:ABC-type amino acid transport substrate-binding protein
MNTVETGILKICTYSDFAPVCAVRKGGKTAWGTDISFLNKFAADHRLIPSWEVLDTFKGIWTEPGNDKCDIAAAGITETAARKAESPGTVWSKEYFHVQRSFLIRKTDIDVFRTIYDFGGKKVAVTKGSTADLDFQARHPENVEVFYYSNQGDAIGALIDGKIDAFGEGDVSNDYLASQTPGLHVIDRHDMAGRREPFSFPVRAASGIIDALNAWLATKTEDDYRDIEELKPVKG